MAVTFKMVPKKNIMVNPPVIKYYPCAVSQGKVDLESLAQVVASRTTMSEADCYGVMVALTKAIGDALMKGTIVDLDFLGSFSLTLQGNPADSAEELGKTTIKKVNIAYKPAKTLKNRVQETTFTRLR
jgi:predicted histone-like DNA-binding protein